MLKVLTLNIAHGAPSLPVPLPFLLPRHRLLEHLATRAGYAHVFHGPHLHLRGLCIRGTALLSHGPLLERDSEGFVGVNAIDKGYVVAAVDAGGGRLLDVVSTHLDYASERRRERQALRIIEALQRRPRRPRLVMGDMNSRQKNPGVGVERMMKQLELSCTPPSRAGASPPTRPTHRSSGWTGCVPRTAFREPPRARRARLRPPGGGGGAGVARLSEGLGSSARAPGNPLAKVARPVRLRGCRQRQEAASVLQALVHLDP